MTTDTRTFPLTPGLNSSSGSSGSASAGASFATTLKNNEHQPTMASCVLKWGGRSNYRELAIGDLLLLGAAKAHKCSVFKRLYYNPQHLSGIIAGLVNQIRAYAE